MSSVGFMFTRCPKLYRGGHNERREKESDRVWGKFEKNFDPSRNWSLEISLEMFHTYTRT